MRLERCEEGSGCHGSRGLCCLLTGSETHVDTCPSGRSRRGVGGVGVMGGQDSIIVWECVSVV